MASKKFQPIISTENSCRISEAPKSILEVASFWSLFELEQVLTQDKALEPFYILTDDSFKGRLKPYRNENKKFLLLLVRKSH